ncbi:MAG: hypothetical protein IJ690_07655 [Clostridia bacterium]|nr:hypothetical protein [Clostridia bacterium]MBR1654781.1 hypothetical protein [Clostridia bacterium]
MWLLVLILSIKMNLPTSYWILFTLITIIQLLITEPVKYKFYQGFTEAMNKK